MDDSVADTVPDSVADSSPGDSGEELLIMPGDPDFVCPLLDDVPERSLGVELSERPELDGHGWRVVLKTEQPALATVFFAPSDRGHACLHALSTGWYLEEHNLELANLRLDTSYDVVVKLTDLDGNVSRSPILQLQTGAAVQPLPEGFSRLGIDGGTVWFDTTVYGAVPSNLAIVTSIGLCASDYGAPGTGSQAFLLDADGYLVGDYVATDQVQGFGQVHTSVSGGPDYASGNDGFLVHIGGGIPERSQVANLDLLGGVELSISQPALSATNYSLTYQDTVIEDTSALEDIGIGFEGTAHLSILSRNEDGTARSEVVLWDEGLVTSDNQDDTSAWTVWGYQTQTLTDHAKTLTYANSAAYDPVRNEIVVHTHTAHGGAIWGVDIVEQRLAWVFGSDTHELEGYVPDDAIIISEIRDPGLCESPFFARAHQTVVRHGPDDDRDSFYVSMHDNGGDSDGRRNHTRAIVYHLELDEDARVGTADVDWAFPSNELDEDDPLFEVMAYQNYVYGNLVKLPDEDDLYLMTSGTGYCYVDYNDIGLPTREQIVLLRANPGEHTAQVVARYVPGSAGIPFVTLYAAAPTALYAQAGSSAGATGRRSFEVSTKTGE